MTSAPQSAAPAVAAFPSPSKAYVLKFISGKYQGGEFPIPWEKEIIVGRSSDLDMVLVEDMVSRKHAKFMTVGGQMTIQDLGSTNGTFVNGEKIKKARIKEGDRILIGTSILKLVSADASGARQTLVKPNLEEVAASQKKTIGATMTGSLEEVPLPDLLQLFQTSKKSGVLMLKGEREAKIYMKEGRVQSVIIDGNQKISGKKSFNRVVMWSHGTFELLPPPPNAPASDMDESTEHLLMDALRAHDEYVKLKSRLPSLHTPLAVTMPLVARLRVLAPEELDVVQLVLNYGTSQAVLDHSELSDLETAEKLATLIEKLYVRAL